jgi:hypothetical protein
MPAVTKYSRGGGIEYILIVSVIDLFKPNTLGQKLKANRKDSTKFIEQALMTTMNQI